MNRVKTYTYWSIPVLFIVGSLFHFLYDLTRQSTIIGAISPVNESIWEHCKMVVLPIILWWSFSYIVKAKETDIDKDRWFTGALSSLGCAIITIPLLYYFYTNAFGIESLIIDILLLFVAITFGQLLGLHIYSNSKGIDAKIAFFLIIAVLSIFILFTFVTPQLPIFMDGQTGNYGR